MKNGKRRRRLAVLLLLWLSGMQAWGMLLWAAETAQPEAGTEAMSGEEREEEGGEEEARTEGGEEESREEEAKTEAMSGEEMQAEEKGEWQEALLDEVDLAGAQQSLDELLGRNRFSFTGTVKKLLTGEIPWSLEEIKGILKDTFLREIQDYRKTAAYLLVLIVVSSVFSNFMAVFDKGQIADISYYMMYLLMVTLLMKVFSSMSQVAAGAVSAILQFMKALLPACLMTLFFCSGSVTAMGFYKVALAAITGIQWLMGKFLLPAIQVYVILLFVNQMMKEDYLSHMADLLKTGILWMLKTVMAVLFGMQAIQCMLAPAADALKNTALGKAVSAIPGIGGAYETVAETVMESAVLLKNAVGLAGLAALAAVGLVPVVKLVCGVLLYRLLGAVAQPVTDKRVAECIESVAEGGTLLLKMVLYAGILFLISLAMISVMIGG